MESGNAKPSADSRPELRAQQRAGVGPDITAAAASGQQPATRRHSRRPDHCRSAWANLRANAAVHKIFGYPAELVGRPVEVLLPERLRGEHVAKRDKDLTAPVNRSMGEGLKLLAAARTARISRQVNFSPLPTGRQVCVVCVVRDISRSGGNKPNWTRECAIAPLSSKCPLSRSWRRSRVATGRRARCRSAPRSNGCWGSRKPNGLAAQCCGNGCMPTIGIAGTWNSRKPVPMEPTFARVSVLREGRQRRLGARRGEDDSRRQRAPLMLHGIAYDITARKENETLMQRAMRSWSSACRPAPSNWPKPRNNSNWPSRFQRWHLGLERRDGRVLLLRTLFGVARSLRRRCGLAPEIHRIDGAAAPGRRGQHARRLANTLGNLAPF